MTLLEVCLQDVAGAAIAERHGAGRVEVCTDLRNGGTTPPVETVARVLSSVHSVGVQVLIRHRPGDFVHPRAEIAAMVQDIARLRELPRPDGVALGFVVGALTVDARIDVPAVARLVRACGPVPVTFHRAFDAVADQRDGLETLVDLGLHRVLTSGGRETATAGIRALAGLVEQAGERIGILAAGGIRAHDVAAVVSGTGVREVHLRASTAADPWTTSATVVRDVVRALR